MTLRAGEVTLGSVSELCQIPHETPVKHCHLAKRKRAYNFGDAELSERIQRAARTGSPAVDERQGNDRLLGRE